MLELIREHESLFAKVPPTARALPPRGSHRSPGALRQPHLQPPLCLRQLSMPLIAERSGEAGPPSADGQNLGYNEPSPLIQRRPRLIRAYHSYAV